MADANREVFQNGSNYEHHTYARLVANRCITGRNVRHYYDRERHPPELRGRNIGMYYKNRIRWYRPPGHKVHETISISNGVRANIRNLLDQFPATKPAIDINTREGRRYADLWLKTDYLDNILIGIDERIELSMRSEKVSRDPQLDTFLKEELEYKTKNDQSYKSMLAFREKLPSFYSKPEILKLISKNQVIVICGETGCGKTTQVAQFILDDFILNEKGSVCKIICTQPRRISAISVAERVAQERTDPCGGASVGYQIRLEKKMPREQGSITFCTAGILLEQIQNNTTLNGVSHVVLDEIHERDVTCDLLMALIKKIIKKRRDLKVILMSATLNSDRFSQYFRNCPRINIPGFTFPVKEYYLEDVLQMIPYKFPEHSAILHGGWRKHLSKNKIKMNKTQDFLTFIRPFARQLRHLGTYSKRVIDNISNPNSELLDLELVFELVKHICRNEDAGAILVFLPGFMDISNLYKMLTSARDMPASKYRIFPLHSKMASVNQKQIFTRPPPGVRKIIISTNIAETSITIDDVVYVIDCGKIKMKNYNVDDNIETLNSEWVSIANAQQRRGRAGRVQAGVCYHLFTSARKMEMASYPLPEILRTKLNEVILKIKILQLGNVASFLREVMDPPASKSVTTSLNLLKRLNAIDNEEYLTPLGYHLAKLPMDPHTGKMIIMAAMFSCVDPILSIAASLSFKDPFQLPIGREPEINRRKQALAENSKSDHLVLVRALMLWEQAEARGQGRQFCWDYFLSEPILKQLRDMKKQFAEYLYNMKFLSSANPRDRKSNINSNNDSLLKAIICAGLYPNVAKVSKIEKGYNDVKVMTPEDGKCSLFPGSVNVSEKYFQSPFLVYYMKLKSSHIYIHDTTMVHPFPLIFFGDNIEQTLENQQTIITVAEVAKFKCRLAEADIIFDLRSKLSSLLNYKASHPGFVDWDVHDNQVAVLRSIMHLITLEDTGGFEEPVQYQDDSDRAEDHDEFDHGHHDNVDVAFDEVADLDDAQHN